MTGSVIVTGGTGGLGAAVVKKLLADGWQVTVPWIVENELDRLRSDDSALTLVRADLFDPDQARSVVAASTRDGVQLQAVVNLVGGFAMGPRITETSIDDFESLLRLNLRPLYLMTQAALPALIEGGGGSVVGVSAKAAVAPFSGASAYVTAKAAVWAFISAVDAEYRDDGIRSNALLPSVIDTPGNRAAMPESSRKGWVSPEQIADTVAFLVSGAGSAVAGAQVPVPGAG